MGVTDAIKAASEPVTKLIETVSHAIGKAYEPRHIRKMAEAKAYEMRLISEELRNNSDLPIVYNGSQTSVDITDYDSLRQRAGARLAFQEIQKQENIESIVDKACDEIDGKKLESEESVNPDWMSRFITNAGEVSNEEMQAVWAKVLAGEVIQPKSFSLKTLDCIRNLTAEDAMLFSRISKYILQDSFLANDNDLNRKFGISYDDVLRLDECGLINSSGMISLNMTASSDATIILDFDEYILMCKCSDGDNQKVIIGEFPLTQAGKELLSVARTSKFGKQYIRDIVDLVKKNANNCVVTLHKVYERKGNEIRYENAETVLGDSLN